MDKKGFTLIELLGIILILAVIAVITVPIVNNVIEQSKKGAAIDSAYGYMKSVNDFYTKKIYEDSDFEFDDATYLIIDLKDLGLNVTGAQPTDDSWVEMENNEVKRFSLRYGEYVVNYDINTNKVVAFKGDIDENAHSQEFKSLLASISNYLEQLPQNSTIKNSKEDIVFKLNAVPAPPVKPASADDNSWVKFVYENNKITLKDYSIKINEYVFDYNSFAENKIGVTKNGTLREKPLSPISIAGTLKEDGRKYYTTPQTIYFNPKSNNANCEPGTTDCMKWYAYSENSDGTVNMILDHNTTQNTPWVSATDYSGTTTTQIETLGITYPKTKTESNPLGINGQDNWNYKDNGSSLSSPGNWNKGPITLLNKLRQDTEYWSSSIIKRNSYGNYVNKNKYYNSSDSNNINYTIDYTGYNARIITANEIAYITGASSFFDERTTTNNGPSISKTTYAWLFDNLNSSTVSYWTSSTSTYYCYRAWHLYYQGNMYNEGVSSNYIGIRPVITVSKAVLPQE